MAFLCQAALDVLRALGPRDAGNVFGIRADSITQAFNRAAKRSNLAALRFHDLRHEATSKLFEKNLSVMEVSSITGHKTLEMLKRYTHLRPENLVHKIG